MKTVFRLIVGLRKQGRCAIIAANSGAKRTDGAVLSGRHYHTAIARKRKGGFPVKKRILSVLCVLAACLALAGASVSLGVVDNPSFVAVNDTLLPLEDSFIPIAMNGQYYVPYTVLDDSVTGVSLGVFPIYNSTYNTLAVSNRELTLTFSLNSGTCVDQSGTSHNARAVTRNGQIYLPIRYVCEYFGLTYSSRVTSFSSLVRVRSASSILDDNSFVSSAQQKMQERLRDWRNSQSVTAEPEPSPTPTVTTPVPTQPETDKSGVALYLAFRADETDGLEELLARLEYYRIYALFFFPAEELADYDAALRRVLCAGHGVGFLVSGTEPEEIARQTDEGNRLLTQIAHMNTRTVLVPDAAGGEELDAIGAAAGVVCWKTDLNARPDGRTASRQASTVLANADRYSEKVYILSDASAAGAALMSRFLPEAVQDHYTLRLAVETEMK